jgi:phosphoribosylaminoimidazolecarboxamide formyltransferase / IMP cyclohydrolase
MDALTITCSNFFYMNKKISSALISVFYKDGLEPVVAQLQQQGARIYSTGGTQKFIEDLGIKVTPVEELTAVSIYTWRTC